MVTRCVSRYDEPLQRREAVTVFYHATHGPRNEACSVLIRRVFALGTYRAHREVLHVPFKGLQDCDKLVIRTHSVSKSCFSGVVDRSGRASHLPLVAIVDCCLWGLQPNHTFCYAGAFNLFLSFPPSCVPSPLSCPTFFRPTIAGSQVDTIIAGFLVLSLVGLDHEQVTKDEQKVQVIWFEFRQGWRRLWSFPRGEIPC